MNPVRFKSGLNVDVLNTSHLFMLSDNDQILIDNRAAAQVAQVIDGHRDTADVVAAAAQSVEPAIAFAALRSMLEKGYLKKMCLSEGLSVLIWRAEDWIHLARSMGWHLVKCGCCR